MNKLKKLVYEFHSAIIMAKRNNEHASFFKKFPIGQCGNACELLAQYLIDNKIDNIIYVNGTYYGDSFEDIYSHSWLLVNNMIVDITGDQFKYHNFPLTNHVPIYIGSANDFYNAFEVRCSDCYRHIGLDKTSLYYEEELNLYNIILKYI